jgi:RNA polymerase sigma-70 factor (ECF subfamily)
LRLAIFDRVLARTTHTTLLKRLSEGEDRAAWREFCDRYGDLIRGFARRAGCDDHDADDVVQDVLTALVKAMPAFRYDRSKGSFRGYLKTIVVRSVSRRRCQKDPTRSLPAAEEVVDDATTEAQWELEWRQYHLRLAMSSIDTEFSVQDRAAFHRYARQGRDAKETANELGLTIDQVYQAKSRVLRRLAALVAQQVSEEG